jgi:two-component system sensor histidine kinase YesM
MKISLKNRFNRIKLKYRDLPLNIQINLILGFLLLVTISVLTANTYINTLNQINQNLINSSLLVLQETADKINSRLKLVESTVSMISKDSRILSFAQASNNSNESEVEGYLNNCIDFNKYDLHQEGIAYERNLIDDIIFTTDKNIIVARKLHFTTYNVRSLFDNSWFLKAAENKGKMIWTDLFYNKSYEDLLTGSSSEIASQLNQFMLISNIVDGKNFSDAGCVAVSINLQRLSELIDNIDLSQNGNLYIIDKTDKIVAGKDQTQLLNIIDFDKNTAGKITNTQNSQNYFEGRIDNLQHYIFYAPLSINGWKLVLTIPVRELVKSISNTLFSVIIIGIIAFLVITSVSTFVLNNSIHPLKKMLASIKETRKGNLSQKVAVTGCLEVNELSTEYNFMLDKINSLLNTIVDEQKAIRKSELKAFMAQINPHFLYNTLDSIKWLILSGNSNTASKLIASLSTFFRIGLSGGNEVITVRDEVEHARQYLFIQKVRCGDNMDYLIDVDTEVESFKTPKLILQPLVENAIYHGLNKKEGLGFIKVLVHKKDENTILFEIIDNGIGMSPDEQDALNKKINNPLLQSTAGSHGYAIRNVNHRIKLICGEEYGISYESRYLLGTKVFVTIPASF